MEITVAKIFRPLLWPWAYFMHEWADAAALSAPPINPALIYKTEMICNEMKSSARGFHLSSV